MRSLVIVSAYAGFQGAVLDAGLPVATAVITAEIGLAAALPAAVERLLLQAGPGLDLVAVVVGPGSFTGLRAGIAVAAGVGLALGLPVIGVTIAEAMAEHLANLGGRTLWTAIEARRGRIFLDQGSGFTGVATDALPIALGPLAICGNAANLVAASLAARGANVMLTAARIPPPAAVAAVALRRLAGTLPMIPAEPLYVDAPEARLPAGGLRAAPA